MSKSHFSIQQAADELGVSTKSIRRWIALGYVDAYRVGPKLLRIPAASVALLAGGTPSSA